jgi:hypothetical protein
VCQCVCVCGVFLWGGGGGRLLEELKQRIIIVNGENL